MNAIPFPEVSPLNFNEESTEVFANLDGTIMQDVAVSFLPAAEALSFALLLQAKKEFAIIKREMYFIDFIDEYYKISLMVLIF